MREEIDLIYDIENFFNYYSAFKIWMNFGQKIHMNPKALLLENM